MPRTPESRARQAQRIAEWKPWLNSTGPRTHAGKSRSSLNAGKGGIRPKLRQLARSLRRMESADLNHGESSQIMPDRTENHLCSAANHKL